MGVIIEAMRAVVACFAAVALTAVPSASQPVPAGRAHWVALAAGGFLIPEGRTAADLLLEMNALLASPDPVLRDEVAFSAAERWVVRERRVAPSDLRRLRQAWEANLGDGLGEPAGDRVFKRSFSALCLSLIAAHDLAAPFLDRTEVEAFFDRMLDYFQRERDLRGFDESHGWMHTVAHTADALKFLARNPRLAPGSDARLLAAVRAKVESSDAVFTWGENDRMALALHAVVRRDDAEPAAYAAWLGQWAADYQALWSRGPQVAPRQFARVENGRQVLRSLVAALAMDAQPTGHGEAARTATLVALAKMR